MWAALQPYVSARRSSASQAFAGCSFAIEHFGATVPDCTEGL